LRGSPLEGYHAASLLILEMCFDNLECKGVECCIEVAASDASNLHQILSQMFYILSRSFWMRGHTQSKALKLGF
jgi:hypothetical protein